MSEYRNKRRYIRSNEAKKKQIPSMIRIDVEDYDLVSVSVDGSNQNQGQHK